MTEQAHTDPSGMPEDERMSPGEFRVIREFLGLTGDWLAGHLGVAPRTVRRWEQGGYPIPDGVRLEIEDLERCTSEFVHLIAQKLLDMPEPGLVVYRTDADYHAANPDIRFPAAWHRAVVARIALEVPTLRIDYADRVEQMTAEDVQVQLRQTGHAAD